MGNLVDRLERENQTVTFNVVITPEMEKIYMTYLQTIGIISALLSILIILLIIFRSPSQSSTRLQFDMIGLQICFLIFDVHICCLFIPKSTLPYSPGYCLGILCGAIRFHLQFIFAIGVTLQTLAIFFICIFQRYVTLTDSIQRAVSPVTMNIIKSSCITAASASPFELFFFDLPEKRMIKQIEFIVFSTFLTIPIMIILVRLMFVLDSGSILFFISESILCYHGLANSIIAVSFNSNFRRAIREGFTRNPLIGKRPSITAINQHRLSFALSRY